MSSVKITELSNVLGSQINPSVDVLPIVRVGANSTDKITVEELGTLFGGGGGLEGSQYIYVAANGTDIENAAELQAAYTAAQMRLPTSTKRITIIAGPGNYNFESNVFTMDTSFIDLVSLDGNRSIIFNSSDIGGTISITANNVFVKGIDILTKRFLIADNLNFTTVENCKALGDFSFGGDFFTIPTNLSSTFINCEGGNFSFKAQNHSGTFIGLKTGGSALGYNDTFSTASGFFKDITCGPFTLSNDNTGTFINLTGGAFNSSKFSGLFYNCTFDSPNPVTIVGGKLYYCVSRVINLPTVSAGGRTYYCINGNGTTDNQ
jgi:hypothetical protein